MKQLTCIDLFCGAGGFSLGFINAGWHVVAAVDANIDALATYYLNLCDEDTKLIGNFLRKDMELIEESRRDWRLFDSGGYDAMRAAGTGPGYRKSSIYAENQNWILRDMLPCRGPEQIGYEREWFPAVNALFYKKAQDITGYEILDAVSDVTNGEQIGVVVGGPPCQGFSRSNKNRKKAQDITGYEILDAVSDVTNGEQIGVVVGGPPCQGFSRSNKNRNTRDTRNFLVFEFGRLVMEINPKTFVMENVPTIQKFKLPDGSNLLETFMKMVNKQDWDIYYEVQALFMDGNMDPEGECTVVPQEQKPIQRTLACPQ